MTATRTAGAFPLSIEEATGERSFNDIDGREVRRALGKAQLDARDFRALLAPAAEPFLEQMAAKSAALTRQRFGRVMQLYAPIYVSNECANHCSYCGFSMELPIERRTLSLDELLAEATHVRSLGFTHILLVSGEFPSRVGADYVERAIAALRPHFASIAIEVAPFSRAVYERWVRAGADGLTLYQETYAKSVYAQVHLTGPKRNYDKRIAALEDAGAAGFRTLGLGVLLGLAPAREDAYRLGLHARALSQRHWRSRIALSFPRIRDTAGAYRAPHPVSDALLLQLLTAMRLLLPDAELVLSTREAPALRDALAPLGITRMSAASKTAPGAYAPSNRSTHLPVAGEQFAIEDNRPLCDVQQALTRLGFEPVLKDFDRAFVGAFA